MNIFLSYNYCLSDIDGSRTGQPSNPPQEIPTNDEPHPSTPHPQKS